MENGETIPSSVSDKVSLNMEERKLHLTESHTTTATDDRYPPDKVTGHDDDRHRPLLSTNGGDDGHGPILNDSGANEVGRRSSSSTSFPPPTHSPTRVVTTTSSSSIFRDDVSAAAADTNTRAGRGSALSLRTLQQPFDISHTHTAAFKSPGGGMAAALGLPFTAVQWKELERQAMIYKYMVASLPVPPDLLIPVTSRKFSDPTVSLGNGSLYSLRYPNRDPEPGRCKRTDGKKWRCSRDVAPHQKYCERHMHRGRPRSRKPVEVHPSVDTSNNKKTRLNQSPLEAGPAAFHSPTAQAGNSLSPLLLGAAQNTSKSPYKEPNRVRGWTTNGEMMATNGVEEQWLHLMDTRKGMPADKHSIYGTNSSILHQGFAEEPLNLFCYTDLQQEHIQSRNDDCHMFLNSGLISLKQPQMDDYPISRGFIDAWSSGNLETMNNKSTISSSQGNLSPSSLNLSIAMAAGNALEEEMRLTDIVRPPGADSEHGRLKDCAASWIPFSSGGPLAEVLQPSNTASGSNPASPYATNADSISPPATAVSSPSGVLQRALFSQSDGSVCNSPTIAVSAAPAELIAFQWLN